MPAAVVVGADVPVDVQDLQLSDLRENDVLVRIEASGLCHSDVSVREGKFPAPTPIVIGHEGAGVVEAVGDRVTDIKPGQHVILQASISCGRCEKCTKGLPSLCRVGQAAILSGYHFDGDARFNNASGQKVGQFACLGTLADRIIVHESTVIAIDERVPFDIAAITGCAVVTGVGTVFNRAKPEPGSTAAVIGCGGIGLCVVQGARIAGHTTIVAIDPIRQKRELALKMGATHTIDPTEDDPVEAVLEINGSTGLDYVYEAVGKPELVEQGWNMLDSDGTVIAIGVAPAGTEIKLPAIEMCITEKTLMASCYGTSRPRSDMPMFLDMYLQGTLDLDPLISRRYTLDQINEAVDELNGGEIHGRGVFSFR